MPFISFTPHIHTHRANRQIPKNNVTLLTTPAYPYPYMVEANWVVPNDVYLIHVVCIGGGQGGGIDVRYNVRGTAYGGGGGGFAWRTNLRVTPGQSIPYILGGGGGAKGASNASDPLGNPGGITQFDYSNPDPSRRIRAYGGGTSIYGAGNINGGAWEGQGGGNGGSGGAPSQGGGGGGGTGGPFGDGGYAAWAYNVAGGNGTGGGAGGGGSRASMQQNDYQYQGGYGGGTDIWNTGTINGLGAAGYVSGGNVDIGTDGQNVGNGYGRGGYGRVTPYNGNYYYYSSSGSQGCIGIFYNRYYPHFITQYYSTIIPNQNLYK